MRRTLPLLLAVVVCLHAGAAPKRRAVRAPSPYDESTVAGWLAAHAQPLASTELQSFSFDLASLGLMIGDADVVGLGEGTHGTHEFHTMKLRVIDYLVRERGFDVVALEAPFPICNRLNAYAQTGVGDPRAILKEMDALGYFFWKDEELAGLLEWMREYNATRGQRPPVQFAGMDVLEEIPASNGVVAYLRDVDPPAAAKVETDYTCIRNGQRDDACYALATKNHADLAAREAELVPRSSATAFHDALHNADIVLQSRFPFGQERDLLLAENALWIREHRGTTRRIILWAHNEHVSRTQSEWAGPKPMGASLLASLGSEYFAIATLTGAGSFHQWMAPRGSTVYTVVTTTFPAPQAQAYESSLRQGSVANYFISLRGTVPTWLSTSSRYNAGGTVQNGGGNAVNGVLPMKFDAAIYLGQTTPTNLLP